MLNKIFVQQRAGNGSSAQTTTGPMVSTITTTVKRAGMFCLAALVATSGAQAFAQSKPAQFVAFNNFVENTRAANASDFLTRADSKVKDASAFEEMRQSILQRYEGIEVTHSFLVGSVHYDCVPVNQQPAIRNFGLSNIAAAPPQELLTKGNLSAEKNVKPATQIDADKPFDEFGNSQRCEAGTIPLFRTTLDTMSHFASLQQFYQKVPGGSQASQSQGVGGPLVATSHKYSYTYQYVNNWGGNSNLNVWSPYVNTSLGEVFSLSQEWYIGGSGTGEQTEEVGWVVYPAMFGDERSHFFIFSTPDGYQHGCWNSSCGDFVQVADSGLLGAPFAHYSSFGGTQYDFSAEYYLYQGNWWLAYQGTWVGYYPGSMYHGGQNTRYAQIIEFGTEGVGTTIWPPEGSGDWSSYGFYYAAYQRNLWYISTSGTSYWDSLTASDPSPACYTISGPYSSTSSGWTRYFYEGGPGGRGC